MIRGTKGLNIDEPDDLDKELELLSRRINNNDPRNAKTDEIVETLFQTSFLPLFSKFIRDSEKFERFYRKMRFSLVAGHELIDPVGNLADILQRIPVAGLDQIHFRCHFEQFKNPSLGHSAYMSNISIAFHPDTYIVVYSNSKKLVKDYTQPLRATEIKEVVAQIMDDHKNLIAESLNAR
ncbi:MAG: hypothetical protein ACO1N1_07545 [Dyadobacter fermentans]